MTSPKTSIGGVKTRYVTLYCRGDTRYQLSFAKLAWISPLRGNYLFTNRQGQRALSMTAEDLAAQFRGNRARLVEAEPLIDRAFSRVMSELTDRFELETASV